MSSYAEALPVFQTGYGRWKDFDPIKWIKDIYAEFLEILHAACPPHGIQRYLASLGVASDTDRA